MPQAGLSTGMPALIDACRAGFWPCAAVRIWPMITTETREGSMPARSRAPLIATAPSSCAGTVAKAPLNEPTGVRAALTMTASSDMGHLLGVEARDLVAQAWLNRHGRRRTH